jgi:hypothetical protein
MHGIKEHGAVSILGVSMPNSWSPTICLCIHLSTAVFLHTKTTFLLVSIYLCILHMFSHSLWTGKTEDWHPIVGWALMTPSRSSDYVPPLDTLMGHRRHSLSIFLA